MWWRKSHEKALSLLGKLNSLHHKTTCCFRKVKVFIKHSDTLYSQQNLNKEIMCSFFFLNLVKKLFSLVAKQVKSGSDGQPTIL